MLGGAAELETKAGELRHQVDRQFARDLIDSVANALGLSATVAEIVKVALPQGMTTLVQDGILKVLEGWTDYAQVRAAAMR